jgi:hypothetical protein
LQHEGQEELKDEWPRYTSKKFQSSTARERKVTCHNPDEGGAGYLRTASEESGHPGLISLAIQLGFVGKGVQVQSLLKSLAQTF